MEFLLELTNQKVYNRLNGKTISQIKESFFANYIAGLLFIRCNDYQSLTIFREHRHESVNKLIPKMSDINYWAASVFNLNDKIFKTILSERLYKTLRLDTAGINDKIVKELLDVIVLPEDQIQWKRTCNILNILSQKMNVNSSFLKKTLPLLSEWNSISDNKKSLAFNNCYNFFMQVDDRKSKLFERLTSLIPKYMLSIAKEKVIGFKNLSESDDISVAGNIASINPVIGKAITRNLNPVESSEKEINKKRFTILDGNVIKRKKKAFKLNIYKMPEPTQRNIKK